MPSRSEPFFASGSLQLPKNTPSPEVLGLANLLLSVLVIQKSSGVGDDVTLTSSCRKTAFHQQPCSRHLRKPQRDILNPFSRFIFEQTHRLELHPSTSSCRALPPRAKDLEAHASMSDIGSTTTCADLTTRFSQAARASPSSPRRSPLCPQASSLPTVLPNLNLLTPTKQLPRHQRQSTLEP